MRCSQKGRAHQGRVCHGPTKARLYRLVLSESWHIVMPYMNESWKIRLSHGTYIYVCTHTHTLLLDQVEID